MAAHPPLAIHLRVQSRSTSPSPSPNARLPLRNLRCFSSACFSPLPSSPLFLPASSFSPVLAYRTLSSPMGSLLPLPPPFLCPFVCPSSGVPTERCCPAGTMACRAGSEADLLCPQGSQTSAPWQQRPVPILPPQFLHRRLNSFLAPSAQLSQSPPSPPPGGSSLGHGLSPGYC